MTTPHEPVADKPAEKKEATQPPRQPVPEPPPSTEVSWGLFAFLILVLAVAIFAIQNTQPVDLRFLVWTSSVPLALLVLIVVAVSVIADEVLGLVLRRRRRRRLREHEELKRLKGK